ncbi:DNA cross-link repair protein pso2/snm1 [Plectosphaerella cucumerina]|uniref:DNA cross-link repair protein pso2/snm1 n=1 Tax=Plectosphaerella cucumerina TaxID=40658 RepID=A0A8K0X5X1_9PEZI|nr:DNA cross-link repair protein pso2/snm1 [Plectosphaerella cucumerina]
MVQSSAPRKRPTATPRKPAAKAMPVSSKKPTRPNASILSFFQKAEKEEEALFVGQNAKPNTFQVPKPPTANDHIYTADVVDEQEARYNESEVSMKKRRLSADDTGENKENKGKLLGSEAGDASSGQDDAIKSSKKSSKRKGPFVDDSDTDDSETEESKPKSLFQLASALRKTSTDGSAHTPTDQPEPKPTLQRETSCPPPPLQLDESVDSAFANVDDFADLDEFLDDDEIGGEEYRMMRFMEEQAKLEEQAAGDIDGSDKEPAETPKEAMVANCPICDGSLAGITPEEATRHVNACLDGNQTPLPRTTRPTVPETTPKTRETTPLATVDAPEMSKRFARAAVPRAGQSNPFEVSGSSANKAPSAFAQLMSGHAENAAWADAAAAENASRGRPAYERTCPFYKIMPNFYICVDAFRYGAVKGCNAYFLSHFHSDHYIGLTSSWQHGPIYCSKVTGDLCKMQLRVAAQWIVPLEFEETVEVPGTQGVTVTMIPANHCPGSSLFLFEKTLGSGPNAKKQRILHCGDFRACPAHVTHPLLKPDVQDAITGKVKQQKIDICYLDTTYLNPRYSFPPQEDVSQSCAELCASLSPDPNSTDDAWDRMTRKGGTGSVSKYFTSLKEPAEGEGPEDSTEAAAAPMSAGAEFFANVKDKKPPTPRQRLLVICGTYSIGKERICIAIAKALKTKIFASAAKIRICSKLGDPELAALMTSDPLEAQVHMQMLMEIRAETLRDYLDSYKPHFSRIVGFRPSGWNYRPSAAGQAGASSGPSITASANTPPSTIPTTSILHSQTWASRFKASDMTPQRGSTRDAMCFGVPYSEHSSFRELAMFVMALRIERVVPTVNVGSEPSRRRMKAWVDRWMAERRKGGLVKALIESQDGDRQAPGKDVKLWDGKDGKGGGAWW